MLVFSEKKAEVDDIHMYLLLKGVQAVSIHGGKGNYCLHKAYFGVCFSIVVSSLILLPRSGRSSVVNS